MLNKLSDQSPQQFNISKKLADFWGESFVKVSECTVLTNSPLETFRWNTLLTKEPETIEWIKNMNETSVMLDIGANIGVFSLAALIRGVSHVVCFEPYHLNFSALVKNIFSNDLLNFSSLYCVAISEFNHMLHFANPVQSTIGIAEFQQLSDSDDKSHPVICLPISDFYSDPNILKSTHIKIDVDGPELSVLSSCNELLGSPSLQSVLVECSVGGTEEMVIDFMRSKSFLIDDFYETLANHSSLRRRKEQGNIARNIIFKRCYQ